MYNSTQDTRSHINRVRELLQHVQGRLFDRAVDHDASKITDPLEKRGYDLLGERQRGLTYGSPEYYAQFNQVPEMKTAVLRHYVANRHHPEHFVEGVDDFDAYKEATKTGDAIAKMTLLDLVEMVADWKAASERHNDGSIAASIEHNTERFGLSPQLAAVIRNTIEEMGW